MNKPLVSVIITTFNRPALLSRSIESVLAQTYDNLELIIVDDSSDDSAKAVCDSFNDSRIVYTRNCFSKGACGARNTGINLASGVYYAGLDDDDAFAPTRIERLYNEYTPHLSFVTSNTIEVSKSGRRALYKGRRRVRFSDILWGNCVGTQVFSETYKVKQIGGFDENLLSAQDADMWLRMVERWGEGLRIAEPLYYMYVDHDAPRISTSSKKIDGLRQFYEKHQLKMSGAQRALRRLKIKRSRKGVYAIELLFFLLHPQSFRYFLTRLAGKW